MKVSCKCCHKVFDYDMYMGLCPKCGVVYRRGREHYSNIERDMMGSFHLDADEGGLNRGIHGVVYNQGSTSEKEVLNRASKATINKELGEPGESYDVLDDRRGISTSGTRTAGAGTTGTRTSGTGTTGSRTTGTAGSRYAASGGGAGAGRYSGSHATFSSNMAAHTGTMSNSDVQAIMNEFNKARGQNYYSANHSTRMNQGVTRKKNSSSLGVILAIVIFIIIGILSDILG